MVLIINFPASPHVVSESPSFLHGLIPLFHNTKTHILVLAKSSIQAMKPSFVFISTEYPVYLGYQYNNSLAWLMSQNKSIFPNIISDHNDDKFFQKRVNKLKEINSYHMFAIKFAAIGDHPLYIYRQMDLFNLNQLIEDRVELLPSEIKCIVWQITKLMLCCEELEINHLRLYPKSIILKEKHRPSHPIFVYVKDFSLGKEFQSVKDGKVQQIFEYLHPYHSINNNMVSFEDFHPEYDIWSLGIIIYKLIYFQNPFYKEGRKVFSKTILRDYLAGKCEIPFHKNKYDSINKFISRCLPNSNPNQQFRSWTDIKKFILEEEEIYHQLDFHDGYFEQMAEIHLKVMIFFSMIYCMIIDQCRDSPNPFWKIPVDSEINLPFQMGICQFTLTFMMTLEERFYRMYSGHLFLIKKQTMNKLTFVSERLKAEQEHMAGKWINRRLCSDNLNSDIISIIQHICVKMKIEASEENEKIEMATIPNESFNSRRIVEQRSKLVLKKKDSKPIKAGKDRKVWKSVQILYDYCSQVMNIVSGSKTRMKYIYEQFYHNSIFDTILSEEFQYRKDFSSVFKRVYKNYIT